MSPQTTLINVGRGRTSSHAAQAVACVGLVVMRRQGRKTAIREDLLRLDAAQHCMTLLDTSPHLVLPGNIIIAWVSLTVACHPSWARQWLDDPRCAAPTGKHTGKKNGLDRRIMGGCKSENGRVDRSVVPHLCLTFLAYPRKA